jgi:hypothetical protein
MELDRLDLQSKKVVHDLLHSVVVLTVVGM